MRVYTGTSGFSFDEWQGQFYPAGLRSEDRLAYYATRLSSVEINNTFYQMPSEGVLRRWHDAVPDEFRFALKAPRRITHVQRLKETDSALRRFLDVTSVLGQKRGPLLFQLPPLVRKDTRLLSEFLTLLPPTLDVALEFRHASWFDEEVFALLTEHNVALCGGDVDDATRSPPLVGTASFGYLRLRAASYDAGRLRAWSDRIVAERWTDAYVFLKHEVQGPEYAIFLGTATAESRTTARTQTPSNQPTATRTRPRRRALQSRQ